MNALNRPSWKSLVSGDRPLVLPGAYDALCARLIESAGFEAFVIGGFPLLGSRYALPDIGLAGLGEMASGVADILGATALPVLVDADHGFSAVDKLQHSLIGCRILNNDLGLTVDSVAARVGGALADRIFDADLVGHEIEPAFFVVGYE